MLLYTINNICFKIKLISEINLQIQIWINTQTEN